jgi:hypothetical protein
MSMKKIIGILFLALAIQCGSAQKLGPERPRTWSLPDHMKENLVNAINEFNRQFQQKVILFKIELRKNYKGYETLPESALLDLDGSRFVHPDDMELYLKPKEGKK